MTRNTIIICIIMLKSINVFSQDVSIKHAIIRSNDLYVPKIDVDGMDYLAIWNLNIKVDYPRVQETILSGNWKISTDTTLICIAHHKFINYEIPKLDSLTEHKKEIKAAKRIRDSINSEDEYLKFVLKKLPKQTMAENRRPIMPANKYNKLFSLINSRLKRNFMEEMEYPQTVKDFVIIEPDSLHYFHRDDRYLSVWAFKYPSKGHKSNDSVDWKELFTLTCDTSRNIKYPYLFKVSTFKKINYNAIKDTTFFECNLSFILQDDNYYAIDLDYGRIFYISPTVINKIGVVRMDKYIPFMDDNIFIEDRDNNEIIFFAPIEWEDTDLPKPRVRVMNKKQMQGKFKYVLD